MDSEKLVDKIEQILLRWSLRETRVLANGTRLIFPTPKIGTDAWLHIIYPPLDRIKREEVETILQISFPNEFSEFLQWANGLALFSNRIKVWGKRETMARTGEAAWQPLDIVDHNYEGEHPRGTPSNIVYFGSSDNGIYRCFFELDEKFYRVGKTKREQFSPSLYWLDFGSWLLDEAARIEKATNSDGEVLM